MNQTCRTLLEKLEQTHKWCTLWTPSHDQRKAGRPAVPIWDVALKTCRKQWMMEKGGKSGSWISVLMARHDDDDICHKGILVGHFKCHASNTMAEKALSACRQDYVAFLSLGLTYQPTYNRWGASIWTFITERTSFSMCGERVVVTSRPWTCFLDTSLQHVLSFGNGSSISLGASFSLYHLVLSP